MSITTQPLATELFNAVVHCPHLKHRQLHIKSDQGRVIIKGTVTSFFEKQMAQETLRKIDGVESIENQLEVHWLN
jgi:osmotically-inducible protein OsmY